VAAAAAVVAAAAVAGDATSGNSRRRWIADWVGGGGASASPPVPAWATAGGWDPSFLAAGRGRALAVGVLALDARERLDCFARLFPLLNRAEAMPRERKVEPAGGRVGASTDSTPRAGVVVVSSTLEPKQRTNGNPVFGVFEPNRFVDHA
jgi:hypothetical protein